MRATLKAHGRLYIGPMLVVAREARALLREKIEALRPPPDAPDRAERAYIALRCFVQGDKLWVTAKTLGLSQRQATRERARAVALLRAELEAGGANERPTPP